MKTEAETLDESQEFKILVVDDVPENLSVLFDFLLSNHYRVLVAQDGESALEVLQVEEVDLILLDIMMPGLNGFEVCSLLKQDPKTVDIPIIFMTALADMNDKLKGFSAGAVDYITKPFQQKEILARIRTHLTLRKLQHALAQQNKTLVETNQQLAQKNKALEEKNAELDAFSHTVAHDLKNPLGNILGFSILLQQQLTGKITEEELQFVTHIELSARKINDIIESLLLLAGTSKTRQLILSPLDMSSIVQSVLMRLESVIHKTNAVVEMPAQWPTVYGYAPWIEEVWMNYLTNGIKYGGNPPRLQLSTERITEQGQVKFWVQDNGTGLTEQEQALLFTPFTRLHQKKAEGHGLGLCVVESIIRKLGGMTGVSSTIGQGSGFYFSLPVTALAAETEAEPKLLIMQ
jgi:signal transduction histidine kinase